jgi:hypothetical protein
MLRSASTLAAFIFCAPGQAPGKAPKLLEGFYKEGRLLFTSRGVAR